MSVSPGIPRMSFTQRPHASMSRLRLLFKIALFLYGILSKTSKLGPNIQIFSRMPLWLAVGLMVYPSIHSLVNWSVGPLVFWSIGPSTADYKAQATCGNWPWKKTGFCLWTLVTLLQLIRRSKTHKLLLHFASRAKWLSKVCEFKNFSFSTSSFSLHKL